MRCARCSASFCVRVVVGCCLVFFFFFNDTATTEIYTLSLHDALPISSNGATPAKLFRVSTMRDAGHSDRKSTRLNSSHDDISYAVFCLKKKKQHAARRSRCPPDRHLRWNGTTWRTP